MTTFKPIKTFQKLALISNVLLTLTLLVVIGEVSGIFFGCLAFFNLIFALPSCLLMTRVLSWRNGGTFWAQAKPKKLRQTRAKGQRQNRSKRERKGSHIFGSRLFSATRIGLDHNGEVTSGAPVFEI